MAVTIKRKAPCRLLIFGLGNDGLFWHKLNRGGVTVFLEDNLDWYNKITSRSYYLNAFLVNYHTKRGDWRVLLDSPALLEMTLPERVENEAWDIILVDAPQGTSDQTPGRMKSIYLASRLVKNLGDVFVHDCHREEEVVYSTTFLKKENLVTEIKSPGGFLRHYHITHRSV
jgi:Polysaccharide biosynthesis